MWRWESMKPGMTIMPDASITSASAVRRPGPTATISPCSMRTSAVVEVADVRVEAEHGAAPDQRPSRRHHAEVGTRRVEVGDHGRGRRSAPDHPAPGSLVVPLHELLDVAGLEQDDPEEHQDARDHHAVLGAQAEERERGDDQRQEHRRDRSADERRPPPGERGPAEHRGRDAAQRVAVADLRVPDPRTRHHHERGEGGEQRRQHQRPHPDPRRCGRRSVSPTARRTRSRAPGVPSRWRGASSRAHTPRSR